MRSPKAPVNEEAQYRASAMPPHNAAGVRRKATTGIRAWLVVSGKGHPYIEEAGKHSIMQRTGLPARDLRVLDPQLSYPSTILGRERAVVINLEHIKAVITATEVLIPNPMDPLVSPFVHDLQERVQSSHGAPHRATAECDYMDAKHLAEAVNKGQTQAGNLRATLDAYSNCGAKVLPFEFRSLEVCLESACRLLESEALTLEQEAYPALDELTSKISTINLERVRQIKSRLVAITGRVQKVRDELERLLDDDMDMAEMYLTEKLARQQVGEALSRVEIGNVELRLDEYREVDVKTETESCTGSVVSFKLNIEELEMLLEAYFVQTDGILNKLSAKRSLQLHFVNLLKMQYLLTNAFLTESFLQLMVLKPNLLFISEKLKEYVDDTEDYINIMLDEKQNQLLQMGVSLSTATLVVTAGIVVVSLFGMNIGIELFNVSTFNQFWETTFGTIGGCVVVYILAIGWAKKSGLLH